MNVWIHLGACGWIYPFLVGDWTFSRNDSKKKNSANADCIFASSEVFKRLLDIIGKSATSPGTTINHNAVL